MIFLIQKRQSLVLGSGGITAGQFGEMSHLKFKIFTQFSVAFEKYFLNF
jgi:hypothetical protein